MPRVLVAVGVVGVVGGLELRAGGGILGRDRLADEVLAVDRCEHVLERPRGVVRLAEHVEAGRAEPHPRVGIVLQVAQVVGRAGDVVLELVERQVVADRVVGDEVDHVAGHERVGLLDLRAVDECVALDRAARCRAGGRPCVPIEQRLGRLALHDEVRNRVGVLLVAIADLADAALELDAAALLDDVGSLVCRGVEVGRPGERDVIADRERARAHRRRALGRRAADVGLDRADVVAAERLLDRREVGQGGRAAGDAVRCGGVDVGLRGAGGGAVLDDRRVELRGQRLLARAERRGGAGGGARGRERGRDRRHDSIGSKLTSASMRAATATSPGSYDIPYPEIPKNPV